MIETVPLANAAEAYGRMMRNDFPSCANADFAAR
jgi:hypothetical protein